MDTAIIWLTLVSGFAVVYYIGYFNGKVKLARHYLPIIKEVRQAVEMSDRFRKKLFKENQRLKHENLILKDELNGNHDD